VYVSKTLAAVLSVLNFSVILLPKMISRYFTVCTMRCSIHLFLILPQGLQVFRRNDYLSFCVISPYVAVPTQWLCSIQVMMQFANSMKSMPLFHMCVCVCLCVRERVWVYIYIHTHRGNTYYIGIAREKNKITFICHGYIIYICVFTVQYWVKDRYLRHSELFLLLSPAGIVTIFLCLQWHYFGSDTSKRAVISNILPFQNLPSLRFLQNQSAFLSSSCYFLRVIQSAWHGPPVCFYCCQPSATLTGTSLRVKKAADIIPLLPFLWVDGHGWALRCHDTFCFGI
jgi:hypothetical protein